MRLSKVRNAALVLLIVIFSAGVGYRQGMMVAKTRTSISTEISSEVNMNLFWEVWGRLNEQYLDKKSLDVSKMVYGAIRGMTAALEDPYTAFLAPNDNARSKEDLSGEFGGVGIQLGFIDKTLGVIAPLPDSPAEKVGIKAGDLILKIKDDLQKIDRDTQGISLTEAMDLIRGKEGTTVVLTIGREGESDLKEVAIVREQINVPSVDLSFVDNGQVAWLRVYRFGDKTKQEWDKAVGEILTKKGGTFKGIILDLRNNPGGYLRGAVELAGDFVTDGVVVQQEGRDKTEKFSVNGEARLSEVPLVVLVNQGSASASEILAGALRERLGVKVVGEKTFGKGTVQEAQELSEGAGLHVTIARWLLPSGKNIHGEGLEPDVVIKYEQNKDNPDFDNQLEKAIGELKRG